MKRPWLFFQIIFLFSSFSFSEDFKQVKVVNGFDSTCDNHNESQINNNRPIAINVLEVKKQSSSTLLKLELVFVKCEKNQWKASNQQNFSYDYADSVGQKINETVSFAKFKINILGKNETSIFSSDLGSDPQSKNTLDIKISNKDLIKENKKDLHQSIELSISAEKTRKNAADIEISTVNWGKIKLNL